MRQDPKQYDYEIGNEPINYMEIVLVAALGMGLFMWAFSERLAVWITLIIERLGG